MRDQLLQQHKSDIGNLDDGDLLASAASARKFVHFCFEVDFVSFDFCGDADKFPYIHCEFSHKTRECIPCVVTGIAITLYGILAGSVYTSLSLSLSLVRRCN